MYDSIYDIPPGPTMYSPCCPVHDIIAELQEQRMYTLSLEEDNLVQRTREEDAEKTRLETRIANAHSVIHANKVMLLRRDYDDD